MALWDIIAELVEVCTIPCPPNPFAVDMQLFRDNMLVPERVVASGAMIHFLQRVLDAGVHAYDRRILADIAELSTLHFASMALAQAGLLDEGCEVVEEEAAEEEARDQDGRRGGGRRRRRQQGEEQEQGNSVFLAQNFSSLMATQRMTTTSGSGGGGNGGNSGPATRMVSGAVGTIRSGAGGSTTGTAVNSHFPALVE